MRRPAAGCEDAHVHAHPLGFMQMSSGWRFSLEQLMVESGRLQTGQLDPVSSGAAAAAVGGVAAAAAAAAPAPLDHF